MFVVWHIPASFTLLTDYLQIRQIIQHKHIICDPAQNAHLSCISIQMMWGMISDYRWGLKERCRNEGNGAEGSHNDSHLLSPQAKSHLTTSVSMDGIPWGLDGESIQIMDIKTEVIWSVVAVCFKNKMMAYLIAGWFWARSLGKLCDKEYMQHYHLTHGCWSYHWCYAA